MTPTLSSALVTLRPLTPSDAPALVAAASDGVLWDLPFTVVPSTDTVEAYIAKALQGEREGSVMPFVVTLTADGHVIGSTRFGRSTATIASWRSATPGTHDPGKGRRPTRKASCCCCIMLSNNLNAFAFSSRPTS